MPFFSVVIPLYNKENYIEATVKSVLNQSFADFELLIINDASNDASLEKVIGLASAKVKIIKHSKNKGLSATRNTGISATSAQYIAFLDADDTWDSHYLATIADLIQEFPKANLFATHYLEIYSKSVALKPKSPIQKNNPFIVPDFFEASLNQPIYCPSSLCVHKKVLESVGNYNEQITFAEDIDFNIRANLNFKLAYVPQPLVQYRMFSENKITTSSVKNKLLPNLDSYEKYTKGNPSLKKYLDFHRYIFAKMYKIEKEEQTYQKLKKAIASDPFVSGLNPLQRLLLIAPRKLLLFVQYLKKYLVKKGYRITTY